VCTLILGNGILGSGTVIVAANRDESPARRSEPPRILNQAPRVAGGRDAMAGGTWLAVRERRAVVALLNRRDPLRRNGAPPAPDLRSRGLLVLDVALASDENDSMLRAAGERALASIRSARYAPFSLVFASPEGAWMIAHDGSGAPAVESIGAGWHVVTHAELDDAEEPRTLRLLSGFRGWSPATLAEAEEGLHQRLALHGSGSEPAVCIHDGPMVTVSSSLVVLTRSAAYYRHLEGRPCEHPYTDQSDMLSGDLDVARVE